MKMFFQNLVDTAKWIILWTLAYERPAGETEEIMLAKIWIYFLTCKWFDSCCSAIRLNEIKYHQFECRSTSAAHIPSICESVKRMDALLRKWNRNWLEKMSNALHRWISITAVFRFIESLESSNRNWLKHRVGCQCHLSWDLMRKYQTKLMNSIACCLHLGCQWNLPHSLSKDFFYVHALSQCSIFECKIIDGKIEKLKNRKLSQYRAQGQQIEETNEW